MAAAPSASWAALADRRSAASLVASGRTVYDAISAEFALAQRAVSSEGSLSTLRLAGVRVAIRVVGSALAQRLTASFRPRVETFAPESAELAIDAWDEAATGVPSAAAPADRNLGPYGAVTFSPDETIVAWQREDSTSWLDVGAGRIIAWHRSADRLCLDQQAKPFHKLLAVLLRERGVTLAHAGLVARRGRGLLLTGKGGAGKSTTSLAALTAGFDFLGDDFVGLTETEAGGFEGHALFAGALLERGHLSRFPTLAGAAIAATLPHEEKSLLLPHDAGFERLPASVPVSAVVLPKVTGASRAVLRSASKAEALQALAPSSLGLLPRPHRSVFEALARLVAHVPAFWLELGAVETISGRLEELADRLPAPTARRRP